MDFALHKIMHAFDGKNKSIQYKIASDINSTIVDDSLNIYDTIQGYCADIAAVGDGRQSTVNSINACSLYTSDAADDLLCVELGGRRIIKKKT